MLPHTTIPHTQNSLGQRASIHLHLPQQRLHQPRHLLRRRPQTLLGESAIDTGALKIDLNALLTAFFPPIRAKTKVVSFLVSDQMPLNLM